MTGEEVLQHVVAIPRSPLGDVTGWCWLGDVARNVTGSSDGRRVWQRVAKLEHAGLLESRRRRSGMTDLRATPRGREVDAILIGITATRGGVFRPRTQAGISLHEELALR